MGFGGLGCGSLGVWGLECRIRGRLRGFDAVSCQNDLVPPLLKDAAPQIVRALEDLELYSGCQHVV